MRNIESVLRWIEWKWTSINSILDHELLAILVSLRQSLFEKDAFLTTKAHSDIDHNKQDLNVSVEAPRGTPAAPPNLIRVDDSKALACYANFCRVTGTPEEMIIDFGLNPQPMGVPTEPVVINQRLVTNFYTAKRMLHALQLTLQRHEATFGVIEVDVQKRVTPRPQG
ncbi:MAG TPA: DUF3467 domain-containing protein [Lacipirellulaceae bacterium]|nr:DUF3467 domain-containing protein [Lacipirellulaceae bacterium]